MYPEIEPFESGLLRTDDQSDVYWEVSGHPDGKPAIVLHGGPGAGSSPFHRRFFDPDRYRIVLLDQRGCGRSAPHAGEYSTDLATNTTWHLVDDLERLRALLSVDRWLVLGGSWGSTLGLAYAQAHPERVSELILTGVCTSRLSETRWYWGGGAAQMFPDAWASFCAPLPDGARDFPHNVDAYGRLLEHSDPDVRLAATRAWNGWDEATFMVGDPGEPLFGGAVTAAEYAMARLCNHYLRHSGWLADEQLMSDAHRLAEIPGVLVQGRYDVQTPARTAWELAAAWPRAELKIVDGAGHSPHHPSMRAALVAATDRFALAG